jgi:hypothetical protein
MKLARIEHWRCGEPISWKGGGGYTYVWVADEMTAEELETLCGHARTSYLDAERAAKAATPVAPPGYGAQIMPGIPDDKTVGELRREYDALAKAYKEYQETCDRARKPFGHWLQLHSNGTVKLFWNNEPALQVEIDWGHNHGVTIDHSPTKLQDYPFPQEHDENYDDV